MTTSWTEKRKGTEGIMEVWRKYSEGEEEMKEGGKGRKEGKEECIMKEF